MSFLRLEPFADHFVALGIACVHCAYISYSLMRGGQNISADLCLLVLLYNTNFMNKQIGNNDSLIVHIFSIYKISPTFHSIGKFGPLSKRKRVLCWSIYVYYTFMTCCVCRLRRVLVFTWMSSSSPSSTSSVASSGGPGPVLPPSGGPGNSITNSVSSFFCITEQCTVYKSKF